MRKVMLVMDEIQQMIGLESFLRRMGFDVLSLGKDSMVADALLGFMPEIVIASAHGRNVDGPTVAARVKKSVRPTPRVALCFSGPSPVLSESQLKSIDGLLEVPLAGEASIQMLAELAGVPPGPLLEKFRKFSGAKLSRNDEVVVVQGQRTGPTQTIIQQGPGVARPQRFSGTTEAEWDPKKFPGQASSTRSDRSDRYDQFLDSHAEDLKGGAADHVMPRERAHHYMNKLKKDSEAEQSELDRIQAEKIKFAETLFNESAETQADNPAEKPSEKPADKKKS